MPEVRQVTCWSQPRLRANSRDVIPAAGLEPCLRSSVLPQFAGRRSNWQPDLPGGPYCHQVYSGSPQGSDKHDPITRIRGAGTGSITGRAQCRNFYKDTISFQLNGRTQHPTGDFGKQLNGQNFNGKRSKIKVKLQCESFFNKR